MTDVRHRKAMRAAIMSARGLAGDLRRRRGHLPDMTGGELDAFAAGVDALCDLLAAGGFETVRDARDAVIRAASPWHAGNAVVTLLNVEARRQGIDPHNRKEPRC